jgi:hypothetical protein
MLSYWPSCASPQSNGNAEELKQLDADEPEVNTLARLAVASQNVITKRRLQIPPDNSDLLIAQNISPNFRRFSGRLAPD